MPINYNPETNKNAGTFRIEPGSPPVSAADGNTLLHLLFWLTYTAEGRDFVTINRLGGANTEGQIRANFVAVLEKNFGLMDDGVQDAIVSAHLAADRYITARSTGAADQMGVQDKIYQQNMSFVMDAVGECPGARVLDELVIEFSELEGANPMSTSSLPWFPTASDVLRAVPADALDPLVSPDTRQRITRMLAAFPVEAQTVCYECRLSEQDDRVDLALCLVPPLVKKASSARARCGHSMTRKRIGSGVCRFLEDWLSPSSPYLPQVPFVWSPSIWIVIFPPFRSRAWVCAWRLISSRAGSVCPGANPLSAGELVALAGDGFQRFFDQTIPATVSKSIERCLSVESVDARHFSFMLGREPATFKLDVQLPVSRVSALLDRIGWPGPVHLLQAQLRQLMPWDGQVQLNLVLHPRLAQPLEVEFLTNPLEATPARRELILDALVAAGLCSAGKQTVLRSSMSTPVMNEGGTSTRIGKTWYLKVRFQEDRAVEAKAYVGLLRDCGR